MDLILELSSSAVRRLHLQSLITLIQQHQVPPDDISTRILEKLPTDNVRYKYLDSLPANINVCSTGASKITSKKRARYHQYIVKRNPCLQPGIAYIVEKHKESGAYAGVFTEVAYNGHNAVIKSIEELDAGLYEIVTQMYLSEQLEQLKSDVNKEKAAVYKNIKVPSILFLKRVIRQRCMVDVCMEKANGIEISSLPSELASLIAFAHVCKALWHLQRDYNFMHRDLSGKNVMYDAAEKTVTFIDFGFSCVNPLAQQSWQDPDQTFFKQYDGIETFASKCTNRSLDLCTLIAHQAFYKVPWFVQETEKMKRELKKVIDDSPKTFAKNELRLPVGNSSQTPKGRALDRQQFTAIDSPNWSLGNLLTGEHEYFHWWLYNMVEFPIEQWYPEQVLTRVLQVIPIAEWFAIRRNWTTMFDATIMPKGIRIEIRDSNHEFNNMVGILLKLHRKNQLTLQFVEKIVHVPVSICHKNNIISEKLNSNSLFLI